MFESGSGLRRWLAEQPPFIEVGIGMVFLLVLAPGVLAAVALLFARVKIRAAAVERSITSFLTPKSAHAMDQIARHRSKSTHDAASRGHATH